MYHSRFFWTGGLADDPPPNWPHDYTLVAKIDQDGLPPRKALDHAFALTQNIEKSWTQHAGVSARGTHHRSTSAGDIVVLDDGDVYRCETNGWSHLTTTWVAKLQNELLRRRSIVSSEGPQAFPRRPGER